MELKYSVQKDVIKTGNVACVQTSPISFVAHNGQRERGAEDEHGEWENDKWEENLLWTLALSVTSFPVLCFVPIFHFPPPYARSFSPIPRLSNINVWKRLVSDQN